MRLVWRSRQCGLGLLSLSSTFKTRRERKKERKQYLKYMNLVCPQVTVPKPDKKMYRTKKGKWIAFG